MSEITALKHQMQLTKWTERIHRCQTSGMKVPDWCSANGLNVKTYYYWLKRVREQSLSNLPSEFTSKVPMAKSGSIPAAAEEKVSFRKLEVTSPVPNMQAAVIVRLPYATIEVANDATQHTVEAVLLALKSVC